MGLGLGWVTSYMEHIQQRDESTYINREGLGQSGMLFHSLPIFNDNLAARLNNITKAHRNISNVNLSFGNFSGCLSNTRSDKSVYSRSSFARNDLDAE